MAKETTTLGGGCFWCLEAVFDQLKGVDNVVSGFSGGHVKNPSYKLISTGQTGHAEVIQVTFDPEVVSFQDILDVFFTIHDPTTLNRQGADVGTQYRSIILTHSDEQKTIAERTIARLNEQGLWENPIVTEIADYEAFYIAEDVHHNYFANNANQPYCQVVIAPKVAKFRKQHLDRLKA